MRIHYLNLADLLFQKNLPNIRRGTVDLRDFGQADKPEWGEGHQCQMTLRW